MQPAARLKKAWCPVLHRAALCNDQTCGIDIVRRALQAPICPIVENGGRDGQWDRVNGSIAKGCMAFEPGSRLADGHCPDWRCADRACICLRIDRGAPKPHAIKKPLAHAGRSAKAQTGLDQGKALAQIDRGRGSTTIYGSAEAALTPVGDRVV